MGYSKKLPNAQDIQRSLAPSMRQAWHAAWSIMHNIFCLEQVGLEEASWLVSLHGTPCSG